MLGGGYFTAQNKVLPGAYINFVSAAASTPMMGDRGTAAVPVIFSWGPEKEILEVTAEEFRNCSFEIFGYSYEAEEMKLFRELFQNLTKGIFYRLNGGICAANNFATARYSGKRGNAMFTVITMSVNDETKYEVKTLFAGREVDRQTVASAEELTDNEYAIFKKNAVLSETAGIPFTGGTDGEGVTGDDYATFLSAVEPYSFNILCCPSLDEKVKALFAAYTKRMREEAGIKFQTVLYRYEKADYEGVISVENKAEESESGMVYWVTGAEAACEVNKSNENKKYNGELTVNTTYTQIQLTEAVRKGKFMFHKCGNEIRVLMDLNSLTTFTDEKGADFGNNQTVRVLDQIGNDIASLFNTRYLGTVPNDEAGRISLWNDIVSYCKQLSRLRAIEEVEAGTVKVEAGDSKRSVVVSCPVTPVNCMSQLYMTVIVA